MVQSSLGVLSMAGCSNTTSADLQFPVPITIAVFIFKKKEENVSKNRGKREVQTCLKHEPLRCKILALICSKLEPKKLKQLVLTCPKSGPAKKKEESALTCSNLESQRERRMFQVSDPKPSQFCFIFLQTLSM